MQKIFFLLFFLTTNLFASGYGGASGFARSFAQSHNGQKDLLLTLSESIAVIGALGHISGYTSIHKYGRNGDVGSSTFEDIWETGDLYTWPQSASTLYVVSDDPADNPSGNGAREIFISGLDANWNEISEAVATNGTSNSSATSNSFIRVNRAYVSAVGIYAGTSLGSNIGRVQIKRSADNQTQATIGLETGVNTIGLGQTQLARYTVPNNKTALVLQGSANVASSKTAAVIFLARANADNISGDMDAKRVGFEIDELSGSYIRTFSAPLKFGEKTDIWVAAKGSAQGTKIEAQFDMLIVDDPQ